MKAKVISPLVLLAVWEIAVRVGWLDERLVAPPSVVFIEIWHLTKSGELGAALFASLGRVVAGFAIASALGIALGVLMARVRIIETALDPLIELFRPVSPLALFPLFILWFGIGEASKISIVAFSSMFPVILNTYAGVRSIDPNLFRASLSLGATPWEIMKTVVIPGSMPQIFTGLRIGWGIALIVIIAAEMIGAVRGIGYMVLDAQQTFRISRVFASIVVIGALGFLTDLGFRWLRRRMMPWYREA